MEFFEMLTEVWAVRALVASSLVGIMCGALGAFIVLRNMSLIGDALAHAILPGVVVAFILVGYSALGFFVGAVIAGLFTAIGITWIQHSVNTKNDAAIGIVFTAMFSIGVIGISWISRNEGVHLDLKDFLFGNVLGVSNEDLYLTATVTLLVISSIIVLYRYLFISTFQPTIAETMGISVKIIHYYLMLMLSFAVVASLQTVGVILVVAMLITPASTALLLTDKLKHVVFISAVIGLVSAVLGLILAIIFETTPGPAMAVTATLIYLLAVFFAPSKGLLFKTLANNRQRTKIALEDILKQSAKLSDKGNIGMDKLLLNLGFNRNRLEKYLRLLKRDGLLDYQFDQLSLTTSGKKKAIQLVRAHRLWETYLVKEIGLSQEQIHDDAETLEHFLTEELLDEVDEKLGFPTTDPHGSPIPHKQGIQIFALSQMHEMVSGTIAKYQASQEIVNELWKLGLTPGTKFSIIGKDQKGMKITTGDNEIMLSEKLAVKINVLPDDN
jgi:ABC-type Mn2+/Zn2+ transport system permease subunit/Mn-dependent DtxR family transcriptional regulator